MSTQKQKFALFAKLAEMGFTYEESAALRRIEMTLSRWSEAECNGEIQRGDSTGKPYARRSYRVPGPKNEWKETTWPIADREAGALKRLAAIVAARNERHTLATGGDTLHLIIPYHQGDPRGCALYLVKQSDIGAANSIDSVYYRGLAICA